MHQCCLLQKYLIQATAGAQIIFSVIREILEKFKDYPVPKHFINHGVADCFLKNALPKKESNIPARVGYAGNLLRQDIDRMVFLQIINENPEVIFELWGSYGPRQSNIGGNGDEESLAFINQLQIKSNVILHGVVPVETLAIEFQRMDAFLICYDINKDQSRGTNYHKVLEYLSTGRVVISNNITVYQQWNNLIEMVPNRTHNKQIPNLFHKVLSNISYYNLFKKQEERISFAKNHRYNLQLKKMDLTISDFLSKRATACQKAGKHE